MNILCICTGNICRSPMMEHLLKTELPRYGITDAVVASAGITTIDDEPASDHAITAMNEIDIDISAHRSRQITQAMVDNTDVFVVMTPDHGVSLALYYGADPEKMTIPGGGIPDPYGGNLKLYRQCRDALIEAVPQLIEDMKAL